MNIKQKNTLKGLHMSSNDKDFRFDKMAFTYDSGFAGRFSKKFYRLLLSQIQIKENDCVLDVGCGTGIILKGITNITSVNAFGIDSEENMISEAKRKYDHICFQVADCSSMPFSNDMFDIITACMAFHHFPDKDGFARETARVIKPGGYLYIVDPRFPTVIRKSLNFMLRIFKTVGFFGTVSEISDIFSTYGFSLNEIKKDGYAECLVFKMDS